jgi:hypothetical protein
VTTYGVSLHVYLYSISLGKKSLEIPKEYSKAANTGRTDTTMAKKKTNDRAPRNPVKIGVSIVVPEGTAVLAPAVIPVVLLENDTTI